MKPNVAGQKTGCQMILASDGSAFTGTVTVYVTGDAGTQAIGSVGSGVCTHEGNGYHTYAPAQAETNYAHIAFTYIGTGAIPATVQVYTAFPQSGDTYTRLGAPAGASIAADLATIDSEVGTIDTVVDAILVDTGTTLDGKLDTIDTTVDAILADTGTDGVLLPAVEELAIADALLDRTNGVETGLTPRQALRLIAAACAGELSGAETATVLIRNALADSKVRITATVDPDGNRSAVTTDVS